MPADAMPFPDSVETEAARIARGLRHKDLALLDELVERYQYRLVRYLVYLTARRGARALFLGPCLATAEAGPLLLADAWQRHAGKEVILDIPASSAAAAWVRQRGLCEQRQLLRMCRGEVVEECVPQLWASSGPEKG